MPSDVKCDADTMKKSIGIENSVLVRDARPARAPRGAADGSASPPAATLVAFAITTCCAGQLRAEEGRLHEVEVIEHPDPGDSREHVEPAEQDVPALETEAFHEAPPARSLARASC